MAFSFSELVNSLYQALTKSKGELRGYNITPLQYTRSQRISLQRPTNGFTVINQGTTNVQVNDTILLVPTAFIAIGGNEGEEYVGNLTLKFVSNTAVGNSVLVIQKYYTNGQTYDQVGK